MNKNFKMISKIGGLGLAGAMVFGSAGVTAETFNATTTVQNALAVTNVADLDLGTVFATTSSDSEAAFFTLGADGVVTGVTASGTSGFQLLSLSTPTPAQASVAVGSQAEFTVSLPAAEGTAGASAATSMTASNVPVYLCAAGACGNTAVPRLELINFRLGVVTSGSITGGTGTNTVAITPAFGATDVGFNIGATLVTDTDIDSSRTAVLYEPTTYTGTFEVDAAY